LLGRGLMAPANLFFRANRIIEEGAQRAAFGRFAARDMQELTGSWTKAWRLSQDAVDEAARGLVNTPTQRRWMDAQYELLGKYQGFSPTMRAATQTLLPFIPWMLNAARFTFWTMPAHNTVKTALLERVNEVSQQDWQDLHKDVPPGGLKYAIPYVAQARRLREGGGTAFPTSTLIDPQVKPGTTGQMSAVRRTFDPLRPTYLRAPTGGASSQAAPTGAAARAVRRAQRHATRGASPAAIERALKRARRAAGG
jgi:hypothetical protein